MRLTKLEISCVRNLSAVEIECAPGLNLFVGANGAGKTAILEGIHLLARGRSFRTATLGSVIQRGAVALRVGADLEDEQRGALQIRLVKPVAGASQLSINAQPERRVSEVARLMPIQLMLPDGSALVLGGPEERRRFLDWGTFHVEPGYIDALRDYQRTLQQRNAVLRGVREGVSDDSEIDVWNAGLAELGTAVDGFRRRYLARLLPVVERQLQGMAPDVGVEGHYRSGWSEGQSFAESLRESWSRDVKSGVTNRGPHRAELRLDVDSERASATVSRGQAKIIASAMRLAQAEVTAAFGRRRSVFLIDDIGAELDDTHNERFFVALDALRCQVFATATVAPRKPVTFGGDRVKVFHVERGQCRPKHTED